MSFVNALAHVANIEDHHPDLEVGYNYCRVHLHDARHQGPFRERLHLRRQDRPDSPGSEAAPRQDRLACLMTCLLDDLNGLGCPQDQHIRGTPANNPTVTTPAI